jgi:hypothetical protein
MSRIRQHPLIAILPTGRYHPSIINPDVYNYVSRFGRSEAFFRFLDVLNHSPPSQ